MRHGVDRRKLGRTTTERMGMLANMAAGLIYNGRIETTLNRARELRRVVEKLITKGKEDTVHRRRLVMKSLKNQEAVKYLFEEVAPRFKNRNGGYTRILKKSTPRWGDSAEVAFIEFVDYVLPSKKSKVDKDKKKAKSEDQELEKQALAADAGIAHKASRKDSSKKVSSTAAGGAKKSTTVRKISSSS